MLKNSAVLSLLLLAFGSMSAFAHNDGTGANQKLVVSFYNLAFNDHKPGEAMAKYAGENYSQHNPFVADGKEPFINYFLDFQKKHPASHAEIKRVIGEGDLVVLHVHSTMDKKDRGRAVVDIFRIETGKIVEHWDVGQAIPESPANGNTMF